MTTRRRVARWSVAAVLVAGVLPLAGCASEEEQWCARVAEASEELGRTIDRGGPTSGLLDALPTLEQLADDAPSDVQDEWRTLVDALDDLHTAVDQAGLKPEEVTGELPADLPADDRTALEQASLKLASPKVRAAADTVEQQARDVCRTALF